jgi:CheY-like chemotaxis protein
MKLVVCDDDVTLRSVVTRIAESVGHIVIAETDNAEDAVELIMRFGAEALVLDMSLPYGSGIRAVEELRDHGIPCQIVVFTAYADESPDIRQSAVRAIVDKPDFEELERVLAELAHGVTRTELPSERRKAVRARPHVPPLASRTPSGLEEPGAFAEVIDALEPGDGVLIVHVAAAVVVASPWEELVETDRLLAVARNLRTALRVQDRLSIDGPELAALLLDAGRIGIESMWRRLERIHDRSGIGGVLSGGWAVLENGEATFAAVARARDAAHRSIGQPPGDRLWAG